jgi:amidohydrolase
VFIFQPAEEGLGGARAMLADGLFERFPCDEIYALHNAPEGPQGQVSVHSGPMMAGADFFDIRITGRGAHGAHPHQAIDPTAVAITLAQAMQTIVSRNTDPRYPTVVSITQIHAGSAYNVIPETAHLGGTVRTFRDDVREFVRGGRGGAGDRRRGADRHRATAEDGERRLRRHAARGAGRLFLAGTNSGSGRAQPGLHF